MSGQSEPPSGFGAPLFEGHEPDLDIIAVHGIGAHRDYTWSAGGSSWLSKEDMLPSCFPRARIMAYGYASNWLGQMSMATCLVDVADRLLGLLQDLRKHCPDRQLVFIAHCFGGIVVEKALLQALARDTECERTLVASVSGIVLLGTPHRGSSSAGLAQTVAAIATALKRGRRSPILETLSEDSQLLDDTVRNFAVQANKLKLDIHCFYEERETDITPLARSLLGSLVPVSRRTTLVDRDSACLQGHGGTALTLDHFRLNKFDDHQDANYILVKHVLERMVSTPPEISEMKVVRCLEELYVVDPESQLHDIEERWGKWYQPLKRFDTCDNHFRRWQNETNSRVFWITGSTRVEQSIFVSKIISQIAKDPACQLTFYFCENGRDMDSTTVFRGLIWMLIMNNRQLGRHLKWLDAPGRSLTTNVLNIQLLSSVLSKMIKDPTMSTTYIAIDQIHTCAHQMGTLLGFISLNASEQASRAKWVLSTGNGFRTSWLYESWVTESNLEHSTQHPASTLFKPFTMKGLTAENGAYYRIRGFGAFCTLIEARDAMRSVLSAKRQHDFEFCSSLVPSCDNDLTQTVLMKVNYPSTFLECLQKDPSANICVDTPVGRLCVDRYFQGFTQLYANPADESIIADIIAIPDLNKHPYSSWQHGEGSDTIWLQDFFQKDLPRFRMLVYGYAPKVDGEGIRSIGEYCDELLERLYCIRQTSEEIYRPLMLVGHGFGSLIAAQLLLKAVDSRKHERVDNTLSDSITGMILFAIPEKGDVIDGIQSMLENETEFPSRPMIETINCALEQLQDDFWDFEAYIGDRMFLQFMPSRPQKKSQGTSMVWSKLHELFDLDSPTILPTAKTKETVPGDRSSVIQLGATSSPVYRRLIKALRFHEKELVNLRNLEWIEAGKIKPVGITIMHDPPAASIDLVLIPGLGGDPWETWSCTPRSSTRSATLGRFWPQVYLPTTLDNIRVATWGSGNVYKYSLESLLDKAKVLLRDLSAFRPQGRGLMFVVHAEGGLLLKKVLQLSEKARSEVEKDLIRWTSAVVFLVPRRCIALDVPMLQDPGSGSQQVFKGAPGSDAESFSLLQETYGIQASYFLESLETENCDSVQPRLRDCASNQPAPETSRLFSKPNSSMNGINASPQGFCRFESCLENGYIRLSKALRSYADRAKTIDILSREELLSSLYFQQLCDREEFISNNTTRTTTWLFDHPNYTQWSNWSFGPSNRGLLWIKGKPGSGKSTLMKKLLRHLETSGLPSSVPVASYFFTARSNIKLQNSALGLFRTMLYTLISQDRALLSAFVPVFKAKCAKYGAHQGRWKWREEELRAFFESAYTGTYPGVKTAVVLIDALDEVRSESYDAAYRVAQDLVSFFRDLAARGKLKVCLSSRHFPNIEVAGCDQIVVEDFNHDDIAKFVASNFVDSQHPGRALDLGRKIAEKANGVFMWVIVVVGKLRSGLNNDMTASDMVQVLRNLPSELGRLFEEMLDSALSRTEIQKAEEIFQWILLAERPLEKDELRHALTIRRDQGYDETATTPIRQWFQSTDCLDADPKKFLTQLRLYTRGLAEIVLLSEPSEVLEHLVESSDSDLDCSLDDLPMLERWIAEDHQYWMFKCPSNMQTSSGAPLSSHRSPEHFHDEFSDKAKRSAGEPLSDSLSPGYYYKIHLELSEDESDDESPKEKIDLKSSYPKYETEGPWADNARNWFESLRLWRRSRFVAAHRQSIVKNAPRWSAAQFIHESVREFLLFGNGFSLLQADGFHRSLPERHEVLADYCVSCIFQCNAIMKTARRFNQDRMLRSLPFLPYALSGIFYHARQVDHSGKVAKRVLEQLADIRKAFWTAWLFLASLYNKKENARWNTGCSPLHLLAHHRMFLSISFMLELGLDINAQDNNGDSALHYAAREGAGDTVRFLLNTNIQSDHELQGRRHHGKSRASPEFLEALTGLDTSINLQNQAGETALHLAVQAEDLAITQLLLQHGSRTNIKNRRGDTPLHIALRTTGLSMVQVLVKYGADVRFQNFDGKTALHMLVENSSYEQDCFYALGHVGELLFITDFRGLTPLHYAAQKPSMLWLHKLLLTAFERGKLPQLLAMQDRLGRTALHIAAEGVDMDAFRVLFEAGADLEIGDRSGMTPLDYAGEKIARDSSLERQLSLKGYRRTLRQMNGRMASVFTK